MPVPRTVTKRGTIIAWPVKKVLPDGTVQVKGAPNSRKQLRASAMKDWSLRNNARIAELESNKSRRGKA